MLESEHRKIKLIFTWNLHPYWLAFTVLEGSMQLPRGENNNHFYSTVNPENYGWPDKICPGCNGCVCYGKKNSF